jgi:hypothetical protein
MCVSFFTLTGAAAIANCLNENGEFDELAGITPRAVSEIFRLLNERTAQIDFLVMSEIYSSSIIIALSRLHVTTVLCSNN